MKTICIVLLQVMVFAAAANAAGLPEKLLDRPILVQALDSNGKVKSSAFDIISSIPGSDGTFRTLSPDLNAQSWMGACFSVTKNVCARTFNFALDFPTLYAHSSGLLMPRQECSTICLRFQ